MTTCEISDYMKFLQIAEQFKDAERPNCFCFFFVVETFDPRFHLLSMIARILNISKFHLTCYSDLLGWEKSNGEKGDIEQQATGSEKSWQPFNDHRRLSMASMFHYKNSMAYHGPWNCCIVLGFQFQIKWRKQKYRS